MNINILEFLATQVIPYIGTQPRTTQHSVFPRIIHRIIDILGCTQLDHYRELQAVFVPPVTNFIYSYEDGLRNPFLRAQVAASVRGLKEALNIVATDSPGLDGVWALVPICRRFTINNIPYHICADDDGAWNHKINPSIFVNTTLDTLLKQTDISEEERLHLLLKGFAVAIHELGHLLHRYIHYPNTKDTPETLHASTFSSKPVGRGEGGECVEEVAFGGRFDIDFTPHRPHGYRLVGHTRKSKMQVIGVDERVSQVVALLTSPLAIRSPGPPMSPFPCFALPYHVISLYGPTYREIFQAEAPEGLGPQPANINVDEGGSAPGSNHTVQQGLGTPPSYSLVQTPNAATPLVPLDERHARSIACALPVKRW